MVKAQLRYLTRELQVIYKILQKKGKSKEEIEYEKKKYEKLGMGMMIKTKIINPPMIPLSKKRYSIKYGKFMSGSKRVRIFFFDTHERKYRYYRKEDDGNDVYEKAMNLDECEYGITTKKRPGVYKWDDEDSQYRLSMMFEQRKRRPIFVYDNNLNMLQGLKNYGVFCKTINEKYGTRFDLKLIRLLASLSYFNTVVPWNSIKSVLNKMIDKSKRMTVLINSFPIIAQMLDQQKKFLLLAWAYGITHKPKRYRLKPVLRLNRQSTMIPRFRYPIDQDIPEAAKAIFKLYKEYRTRANKDPDNEIAEKARRRSNGISAASVYKISPEIVPIAHGIKEVPKEYKDFTKFNFPNVEFSQPEGIVKLDHINKLIL